MAIDKKIICPLLKTPCIEDGAIVDGELCACNFWVHILGKHPQTGEDINHGNCAINWTPMLLIENSKVSREAGAAIESFRNEMVKANETNTQLLIASTQQTVSLLEVK